MTSPRDPGPVSEERERIEGDMIGARTAFENIGVVDRGVIAEYGRRLLAHTTDLLAALDSRDAVIAALYGALDDCVDAMVESATQAIASKSWDAALDRAESAFEAARLFTKETR